MSDLRSSKTDEQHCPITHKRRFASRKSALRQANYWWGGDPDDYWRAYRCQHCGSVHLTSEPLGANLDRGEDAA